MLDTGSSTSVRTTAAKQLAQLAVKSVRGDVGGDDGVSKQRPHSSLIDSSAWAELMSVVARVSIIFQKKIFEISELRVRCYPFFVLDLTRPEPLLLQRFLKYALSSRHGSLS